MCMWMKVSRDTCARDPGGQPAAGSEVGGLGHRGDQRAGADRPDAGDALQAPARLVGSMPSVNPQLGAGDLLVEQRQCRRQADKTAPRNLRHAPAAAMPSKPLPWARRCGVISASTSQPTTTDPRARRRARGSFDRVSQVRMNFVMPNGGP